MSQGGAVGIEKRNEEVALRKTARSRRSVSTWGSDLMGNVSSRQESQPHLKRQTRTRGRSSRSTKSAFKMGLCSKRLPMRLHLRPLCARHRHSTDGRCNSEAEVQAPGRIDSCGREGTFARENCTRQMAFERPDARSFNRARRDTPAACLRGGEASRNQNRRTDGLARFQRLVSLAR